MWPDRRAFDVAQFCYNVGGALLAAVLAALIILRLARLKGPDQSIMRPLLVAVPLSGGLIALADFGNLNPHNPNEFSLYILECLALVTIPIAFLLSAVLHRALRDAVPLMIREFGPAPTPEQVQSAAAHRVNDPDLRMLIRTRGAYVDVHGHPAVPPSPQDPHRIVDLPADGQPDGLIVLGSPALHRHHDLIEAITQLASLTLENTRMQAAELALIEQVTLSRQRLRDAVDVEQRKIQADMAALIHDQLAPARGSLNALESVLTADQVRQVVDEVDLAIEDLIRLAQGTPPEVLIDEGLGAAVHHAVASIDGPVQLHITSARFAPQIEQTAYFTVCELIANAAKHAPSASLTITAVIADSSLRVTVADTGPGGADPDGHGLRGLADRLQQAGGNFNLSSPPGIGTDVIISLPIPPESHQARRERHTGNSGR